MLSFKFRRLKLCMCRKLATWDCVAADKTTSFDHEEKYRDIVQRRKLVDLAKSQAQEVAVLRAEVERLRMRTFPALVQVER